jgi:adenosylcobinamide kinase/adenosylcobinamide-phosphate guanylyltransferase
MKRILVLGGARSGKSAFAEQCALQSAKQVVYVATATAEDDEMQKRISHHAQRRPANWHVIEEPIHLAETIRQYSKADTCLLIDCLTLWLSNLLNLNKESRRQEVKDLVDVINETSNDIILVSNEVGMGIVPLGELTREFCDETGRLHQQLGQSCDLVILMVAGLPMFVKGKEVIS